MTGKRAVFKIIGIALVAVLALSAIGLAAAQNKDAAQSGNGPLLGVSIVPDDNGARIVAIVPGSAAAEAGLKVGDIITSVDGKQVTADELAAMIQSHAVGDEVALKVNRDGESLDLTATLAAGSANRPSGVAPRVTPRQLMQRAFLGVNLENTDNGVRISEVVADSPAAKAGLQVGDIIKTVNGTDVSTAQNVTEAILQLKPDAKVTLGIERDGNAMTVEATLANRGLTGPMSFSLNDFGLSYDGENWTIDKLPEDDPLYKAGLREGDVLTAFNGEPFDIAKIVETLAQADTNATVKITVTRDGGTQDFDVPVSALKDRIGNFQFGGGIAPGIPFDFGQGGEGRGFGFALPAGGARLGVTFVTLDEQTAAEHHVNVTEGALITDVAADSPADKAGLKMDDIVTAVDGDKVDTERTLRDRLLAYEPGDKVTLDVLRGTETMQIDVTLGQFEMPADVMPFFQGKGGLPFEFRFGPLGPLFRQPAPPQSNTDSNARRL